MEISNEVAIDIVRTFREAMDTPITEHREILLGSLDMAIEALKHQTPKSTWREVKDEDGEILWYRCLNCKHTFLYKTDFCADCGADNREVTQ